MAQRKTAAFLVKLEVPEGCGMIALREYIEDAVRSMKGSYRPENPIFYLNPATVRIKRLPNEDELQ